MTKRLLFAFALAYSFSILVERWGTPLNSPHAFRETQTAMTVYWMVHDDARITGNPEQHRARSGPGSDRGIGAVLDQVAHRWINYQTPVLGPPWTIPFEFPTFQWCARCVAAIFPMDDSGRLTSWLFMIATVWPLTRLSQHHGIDPWILSALYLASPVYLYWGTAFLIETCSLFLCLMFLWMTEEKRWVPGLILGCLAAVTKMTTFVPFAFVALCSRCWVGVAIVPLVGLCGIGWNHWTDLLKVQNPLSAVLMSNQPAQQLHNFGTLAQRLSWEPWEVLWDSIKGLF